MGSVSSSHPLILMVFANDPNDPLDEIQQEMRSLQAILQPVAERLQYDIQILPYSSVDALIRHLDDNRERLILLHFAGHSNSEVLKLDEGVAHASGLVDKLRACQHLQLLFLNGCNNARQVQQFVKVGIPATIGTSTPIQDNLAREFSECFYTELAERGVPITIAFEQAQATLTTKRGDKFRTLNMRSLDDSVLANAQPQWSWFLEQTAPHNWKLEEAAHPCNRLPVLPPKTLAQLPEQPFKNLYYYTPEDAAIFFGRCQPALDVLTLLDDDKFPLLLLHGGTGVGKSSFLGAGLIPRLRARGHSVPEPIRYDENVTLQNLLPNLFGSQQLAEIREKLHTDNPVPSILVIDQLEEIFFLDAGKTTGDDSTVLTKEEWQDNLPDLLNLLLKTLLALFPTNKPEEWPNARIILSLRTEWFGELHDACRQYQLANQDYLLKSLGKNDIIEIIEQPTRMPLLAEKYGLHIQNPPAGRLAEQIADDLLEDKESNIAPPLQIMLSKLWQQVADLPPDQRFWTQTLYEKQRALGLLLSDHIDQQLREISELQNGWGKQAHDSGLLLDILHAYTTPQGTAKTLPIAKYNSDYAHIPFRDVLAKTFTDRYLLIDPLSNKQQLRLAHDSLAQVIRAKYETSELPGQRARRILDSRKADWQIVGDKPKGAALDGYDLKLVEHGQSGTRDWQQDALEKAIIGKSQHRRRNGRIIVGSVITTLILAFIATVFLYLRSEEQRLEANYNLAKAFEEKALVAFDQGNKNKIEQTTKYREAWLYALEAEKMQMPAGKIAVTPTLRGKLLSIDKKLLSPEGWQKTAQKPGYTIFSLAYSPDGKVLASAGSDKSIRLWDVKKGAELQTLNGHSEGVSALAYSPDGKVLASGSWDKTIIFWDAQTGNKLQTLNGHSRPIHTLVYSPDGKLLASAGEDAVIQLWNSQTGTKLQTLSGHDSVIEALAYSPDGKVIASASRDRTVRLWDVETGASLKTFEDHNDAVLDVSYSPDGKLLASISENNIVILWDVQTGNKLSNFSTSSSLYYGSNTVKFSPDGKVLAYGNIQLRNMQTGEDLKAISGGYGPLAYSPDGAVLASAGEDGTLRFWDVSPEQKLQSIIGHSGAVQAVAYSPNGKVLASCSEDKTVRLWDAQTGRELQTLNGHSDIVSGLAYSPDGKIVASGSRDKTVRLWDVQTGKEIKTFNKKDSISALAYSPDGKILAFAGGYYNAIHLWDVNAGIELHTFNNKSTSDKVYALAYSPDGKVLASVGNDNVVRLWNTQTATELQVLSGHTSTVSIISYSPNNKMLATASQDGTLKLWDASNGKLLRSLNVHGTVALTFAPDSKTLAYGSIDYLPSGTPEYLASPTVSHTINILDVQTGSILQTWTAHGSDILSLAYNPDGKVLASGSRDKTIRLWNMTNSTQKLLYEFDPAEVSPVLKFLWQLELNGLTFERKQRPSAYDNGKNIHFIPEPEKGYYFTFTDKTREYIPLLEPQGANETKLDQVIRFLEEQGAYKKSR